MVELSVKVLNVFVYWRLEFAVIEKTESQYQACGENPKYRPKRRFPFEFRNATILTGETFASLQVARNLVSKLTLRSKTAPVFR